MDELDPDAQAQLYAFVQGAIPAHFVAVSAASASVPAGAGPFVAAGPSAAPASCGSWPYNASTAFVPLGEDGGAPSTDEEPRMRLPPRCRYPHAVPGTYYDHLNVKRNATHEAIEEAYRHWRAVGYKAVRMIDPAKADGVDRLVVDARNVLANEAMRREYDAHLPSSTTPLTSPSKAPKATSAAAPISPAMFEDLWT